MNRIIDNALYSFAFFIIGFLLCGILLQWDLLKGTFFDVKITDVLEIIVTLFLGCFIAYILNIKSNKLIKKREVFLEYLNQTEKKVVSIYSNGRSYMVGPNASYEASLLIDLRFLSNQIMLLEKMLQRSNLDIGSLVGDLKCNYYEFKKTLTGNNFKSSSAHYTEREMSDFDCIYEMIMNIIFQAKISIYD